MLFSCQVVFASLWPHGLQHTRLPCPSLSSGVCSDSCPLNWWCHPTSLLLLPSVFPSIRVFSNELALPIRWPEYWSFSFSISPFNEYSGLISFRIDWSDLFVVQETLDSLLQHHISKASVLWSSALFMIQLSHLYMTTGKTIALNESKIGPPTYSGETGTQSQGRRAGEERAVTRDPLETMIKVTDQQDKRSEASAHLLPQVGRWGWTSTWAPWRKRRSGEMIVDLKKYSQSKSWELYFIQGNF